MHTHLKGLHPGGQRNSHNSFRSHRHPNHNQPGLTFHLPAEGVAEPARPSGRTLSIAPSASAFGAGRAWCAVAATSCDCALPSASTALLSGGSGAGGKRHFPPQALPAEATAQCFAYCFFGGPQVQESFDFVGLVVHPREFVRVEPAVGQGGDLEGSALLEVDAERAVEAGRDNHQVVPVADAHGQRIDMRLAEIVVSQYRLGLQQRPGEREQEFVGCRAGITTGRCQPDVRGFQIGARTLNHRKKVSR